ncbi:MAG: DUF4359 domain-containing protein [Anaerobacillus sp.]
MRLKLFCLFAVSALVMFFTNPEQSDYTNWIGKQLKKDQNELIEIGIDLAVVPYIEHHTSRKEVYLFSIYRTELWNGKEVIAIGLFHHFYINTEQFKNFIDW